MFIRLISHPSASQCSCKYDHIKGILLGYDLWQKGKDPPAGVWQTIQIEKVLMLNTWYWQKAKKQCYVDACDRKKWWWCSTWNAPKIVRNVFRKCTTQHLPLYLWPHLMETIIARKTFQQLFHHLWVCHLYAVNLLCHHPKGFIFANVENITSHWAEECCAPVTAFSPVL